MNKLAQIFKKAKRVFLQYPAILTTAFTLALLLTSVVEIASYPLAKFTTVTALGISLFFAVKMFSQRIGKSALLHLLALAILVGFYFLFPKEEGDFSEIELFWIVPSFVLSHLLVSFVPFLRSKEELNFWEYNQNLFINLIVTLFFSQILIGGIEFALFAVQELFNVDIVSEVYFRTFLFLSSFGSVFIFLLLSENGLPFLEKKTEYPIALKFFSQFILIPLLLLYLVILYLYSTKILINWELPRGWVSYLVFAYSFVGIFALLIVYPLKDKSQKSWVKIFSKVFYYTLIPLLVLLYVAIFTRVLEYGYTEARCFVVLMAIWLTSIVLYFVFFKKASIKYIPISLFVLLSFSLITPYFNIFSLAKRSQTNELNKILEKNHLLKNGKIDFNLGISSDTRDEIRSKLKFLKKRKSADFVLNYVDSQMKDTLSKSKSDYDFYSNLIDKFKIIDAENPISHITLESEQNHFDIKDFDYLLNFRQYDSTTKTLKIESDKLLFTFAAGYSNNKIEVKLNDKVRVNLLPQIEKIFRPYYSFHSKHRYHTEGMPEVSLETEIGNYFIKIYFESLTYNKDGKKRYYSYNNAIVLVRKK